MSFFRTLFRLPPKQISAADQIGLEILVNWQEVRVEDISLGIFGERQTVIIRFRGERFDLKPTGHSIEDVKVTAPAAAQNMSGKIAGRIRERVLNEHYHDKQAFIDASAKALLAKLKGGAK